MGIELDGRVAIVAVLRFREAQRLAWEAQTWVN
jgi:hypothetical protein